LAHQLLSRYDGQSCQQCEVQPGLDEKFYFGWMGEELLSRYNSSPEGGFIVTNYMVEMKVE